MLGEVVLGDVVLGDVVGQGLLPIVLVVVEVVDPGVELDDVVGCELDIVDVPEAPELVELLEGVVPGVVVGTHGLLPAGVVGEVVPGAWVWVPAGDWPDGFVLDGEVLGEIVEGVVWGVGVAVCTGGVAVCAGGVAVCGVGAAVPVGAPVPLDWADAINCPEA